jgi:hypothetical protein
MKGFLISFSLTLIVVVLVLLFWPAPAYSQGSCGTERQIRLGLEKGYGEVVTNIGITKHGYLLLIFRSIKTGTWTIVTVDPRGLACGIISGESWEAMAETIAGEPS